VVVVVVAMAVAVNAPDTWYSPALDLPTPEGWKAELA